MSSQKHIYYCDGCKKVMSSIEEVIFVEQVRYRAFCNEKCIIDFFTPLINFFETEEYEFRREFNVEENIKIALNDRERMMDQTLKNPDELWVHGHELSEEIYYYIKKHEEFNDTYMVAATLVFEGYPSFILLELLTTRESVLSFYRRGRKTEARTQQNSNQTSSMENDQESLASNESNEFRELERVDPKLIEFIERKKSFFLAKLLEDRKDNDINFESFPQYDHLLHETLERPDEVYMQEFSEEGAEIPFFIYIKNFQNDEHSFFYVAICLHYSVDHEAMEETLIPIISFPSNDSELYMKYKKGTRIEGQSVS